MGGTKYRTLRGNLIALYSLDLVFLREQPSSANAVGYAPVLQENGA